MLGRLLGWVRRARIVGEHENRDANPRNCALTFELSSSFPPPVRTKKRVSARPSSLPGRRTRSILESYVEMRCQAPMYNVYFGQVHLGMCLRR